MEIAMPAGAKALAEEVAEAEAEVDGARKAGMYLVKVTPADAEVAADAIPPEKVSLSQGLYTLSSLVQKGKLYQLIKHQYLMVKRSHLIIHLHVEGVYESKLFLNLARHLASVKVYYASGLYWCTLSLYFLRDSVLREIDLTKILLIKANTCKREL